MRRFFFPAAIMAIVVGGPFQAQGGDREIAQQIIHKLQVHRDAGSLKDFDLDFKVDKGVVLFRGTVQRPEQKANVLAVANGIEGVTRVDDQIEVGPVAASEPSTIVRPKAMVAEVGGAPSADASAQADRFSLKEALAMQAVSPAALYAPDNQAGSVQRVTNTESDTAQDADARITAAVVAKLGAAQRQGRLVGWGVDVNTRDAKVMLVGRASSHQQRQLIADLVREIPGVVDVVEDIAIIQAPVAAGADNRESTAAGQQPRQTGTPAMVASSRGPSTPVQPAPYRTDQQVPMNQVGVGVPVQAVPLQAVPVQGAYTGMPVPMGPYAGVGAGPRYEQPYLPNYAWPGYAAYPNYAAVSYPQQYSPSAFPYIGPFYPYPQVPLGWRKVSLEWDDGWWFLDFTDR